MRVYCPAHGDWVDLPEDDGTFSVIGPGVRWKCPECEEEFVVEFRPQSSET